MTAALIASGPATFLQPNSPLPFAGGARSSDDPRREIAAGGLIAGLFLISAVAAAFFVPLDAAVVAPGVVKVSGERQKVQSLDGGVISAIGVGEGAHVRQGQVLVEFATADVLATERSLATRVIGLQAEIARLEAERLNMATITAPLAFAAYSGENAANAKHALAMEQSELAARRGASAAETAVLHQRIAQIHDQIQGYAVRRSSLSEQQGLFSQEVDGVRELAAKGYATKNRLLQLERNQADLNGSAGALASESARLQAAAGETRLQIEQNTTTRAQANAQRLREAQTELQALLPQWAAARDQLARTTLRAPMGGAVVGLSVHSVGGVAERGQTLLEIVPDDRSLTVEARLPASNANDVRTGQTARLKVRGLQGRNVPEITGNVTRVSADSFTDDRTGQSYYTLSLKVDRTEADRLVQALGPRGSLRPGNQVDVYMPIRSRTALEYWLEPLNQAFAGSLHEH